MKFLGKKAFSKIGKRTTTSFFLARRLSLPLFGLILSGLCGTPSKSCADTTNVMILLDASGSMAEMIEGRCKIEIAKEAIESVLYQLPPGVRIGLRVYGHLSPKEQHNCLDSRLEIPLDFVDSGAYAQALKPLRPRGYTPLAYSLEQAKNDFGVRGRNVIICVTDGIETCGGDPCAVADSLRKSHLSVVIHVVGFDVGDADREILMCIPENSGGSYFSAQNPEQLKRVLHEALELSVKPGYLRLAFAGVRSNVGYIFAGLFNADNHYLYKSATTAMAVALAPGQYKMRNFSMRVNGDYDPYCPEKVNIDTVRIVSGQLTTIALDQFAVIKAEIVRPEKASRQTWLSFSDVEKRHVVPDRDFNTDLETILLRAGTYDLTCTIRIADKTKSLSIARQVLLPQSYTTLIFDFTQEKSLWWLWAALSAMGIGAVILYLKKAKGDSGLTAMEEFAKYPERFKGKTVTLELRISNSDRRCGEVIPFWSYFPVEVNVMIFVPMRLASLKNLDTRYKVVVTFVCQSGRLDSGNVMVSFRRGGRI